MLHPWEGIFLRTWEGGLYAPRTQSVEKEPHLFRRQSTCTDFLLDGACTGQCSGAVAAAAVISVRKIRFAGKTTLNDVWRLALGGSDPPL